MRQSGDDGEDRREGDRGDDAQQQGAADLEGQQRRRVVHVGRGQRAPREQGGRAVPDHQGEQVEDADDPDRPLHRAPGLLGRGHGVEAHEDVRQAGGAEDQGEGQRQEVDLGRQRLAVLVAGVEQLLAGVLDGRAQQARQVEPVEAQDPHGHDRGADDEQPGLDDLHPGGAAHAAVEDVDDHEDADHRDDQRLAVERGAGRVLDAEQQRDEAAGAGHLGQQVEERHQQRRHRGRGPHRALAHPEAQDVAHGEAADVAQQLGDQQQGRQPGDEEADGVEEAVVAVDRDRARDAEERRGREVVTGDRDAVLRPGERAAGGVVVRRRVRGLADAVDDQQRDDDEEREDPDVERRAPDLGAHRFSSTRCLSASASSSRFLLAKRT